MEPTEQSSVVIETPKVNVNIKSEDVSKEANAASPSDGGSSLMIDSEDDYSNEHEDENFEAWRATEKKLSTTNDSDVYDCEEDLGISMENKNTQRKTDTDIRIFITYLRSINEFRAPELIQPFHLDRYLSAFFSVVKKHDGNEYEPASLRGMLCSVERYLKLKNYPQSVTRDSVFASTRNALKYKQQKLRELGKGSKKQPEPFGKLSLDKVNHLFSAREMGPYTPMSVINTLCFLFIVHFRLRKAIDHKNLLWGDIKLHTGQNGKKCLIYEPVDVQSSIAHSKYDHHGNRLCIWEQPEVSERDPVTIYNLYAEKRPPNMKYENSPFYLGITSMQPSPLQSWYRTCAMGVNKLSDLVRMIRDITGLPRATMNVPTEMILSENYGITSGPGPKQDKNLSLTLVPDTKHSKVFAKASFCTFGNSQTQNDVREKHMPEDPVSRNTNNNNDNAYEDSYHSNETADDVASDSIIHESDQTTDDAEETNIAEKNTTALITAKSTVQKVLQTLDSQDRTAFRKWILSSTFDESEAENSERSLSVDPNKSVAKDFKFPSITLNIKISPDAITGSSPISIVADLKPACQNETVNKCSTEKRKSDTDDKHNTAKRPKDNSNLNPVNLSAENINTAAPKTVEHFQLARRMSINTGNTAVVYPRSEMVESEVDVGTNQESTNNEVNNSLRYKRNNGNSDNLGYIVPMSYPYIGPNCFTQDPRMLINGNVVPHMAHSGVNTSYSFLQSSFRNASKGNNQDTNRF